MSADPATGALVQPQRLPSRQSAMAGMKNCTKRGLDIFHLDDSLNTELSLRRHQDTRDGPAVTQLPWPGRGMDARNGL